MENLIQGFFVSGGLIVAIGAQNAFVLKQGLLKRHTFWISLTCFLCDSILIFLGVLGLGQLISQNQTASVALAFVGALFLLVYGVRAFKAAYQGSSALNLESNAENGTSVFKTILATLAITLLNPHVYLDTVVIMGGIAGTLEMVIFSWCNTGFRFMVFWFRLWRPPAYSIIQTTCYLAHTGFYYRHDYVVD